MKPLKPSSRATKPTSRARLPVRKVSSSRKPVSPRSPPPRVSVTSRPSGIGGPSSGMKHDSPRSKKHSHSPRPQSYSSSHRPPTHGSRGSPISVDRAHSSKRVHLYEKRRMSSRSPVGRRLSPSDSRSISHRRLTPPHVQSSHVGNRSDSPVLPPPHFSAPPKKKVRRDGAHIPPAPRNSSPLDKSHTRMLSEAHLSHKTSSSISGVYSHDRSRDYPSSSSRVNRPPYPIPERPREGYDVSVRQKTMVVNMEPCYSQADHKRSRERHDDYLSDRNKRYGLTLDERFRSVNDEASHDDQRVQFSREDLENITIDIKRSLRDFSPTIRRIVDPSEVKLVRRPSEGHRPIFDREEIKQAPRDLREDAYNEQKMYPSGDHNRPGPFILNYKEMENYEITRHRFESSHAAPSHSDRTYTLSDKWRRLEVQKPPITTLDRDERNHGYSNRPRSPTGFPESRRTHRARSADRDFRPVEHRSRPEYMPPSHKPLPVNPADLRHSLAVRRKDGSVHDARERLIERRGNSHEHPSETRSDSRHYHPGPPKYVSSTDRMRERSRSGSRIRRMEHQRGRGDSPLPRARSVDRIRMKDDKLPDFSQRADRFKYQSWAEKQSVAPKGPSYYEHDDRESSDNFYSRGGVRGFRGRSFRSRSFRGGPPRGVSFRGRGAYRSSISPRGRSYPPRRGRFSPNRWKHDMFAKVSQDSPPGGYPARTR